jgi:hypothetical protein
MQRTEQSKHRAGHEQDRTSERQVGERSVSAEILKLEDFAQTYGARIPACLSSFSAEVPARHDSPHGLHPFS